MIYILLRSLHILYLTRLTLLLLHRVTTTLKIKTIYLLKKLCSSSSTASTGDCESHYVLFILWLFTTKEDTLHLELVLQCFNSLHLDECSTTEDTLRVKAVIDDNNNISISVSLGLVLLGLGLVLGLVLGLMPSSDIVLKSTVLSSSCVPSWHLIWKKKKKTTLSCNIKISAVCFVVSSQSTRVTDRRTDRQTDRITIPRPR